MPELDQTTKRAAIVIGVDRPGDMPQLAAAASGAKEVGEWLAKDGYAIVELTDAEGGKVRQADVYDAVDKCVKAGSLESLVIYFAGHGYYKDGSEVWLLSGAPANSNEAVNLAESAIAARSSGLKNVVFIADTCRSAPPTIRDGAIRGGNIFESRKSQNEAQVDFFYATLLGDPAVEVSAGAAASANYGLFTKTLTDIHKAAPAAGLLDIDLAGRTVRVVPNRRLRTLLPAAFDQQVDALKLTVVQQPALRIESDEPFYLAAATAAPPPTPGGVKMTPFSLGTSPGGIVKAARDIIGRGFLRSIDAPRHPNSESENKLSDEARAYRQSEPEGGFETQCGVLVSGSSIVAVVPLGGIFGELEDPGVPGNRYRVQRALQDNAPCDRPGSVLIQFAEGTGTMVAAIPGYVVSVIVRAGDVIGVNYSPAPNSPLWSDYQYSKSQDQERRAIAATAARNGILAMDREEARKFANFVRAGKVYDPTLGIYAALAYASNGLRADALSVLHYMQSDLAVNLLDVWLFAGAEAAEGQKHPMLPACPMLSQGWAYLAPLGVTDRVNPALRNAARHQALWTTFASEAMGDLLAAATEGKLGCPSRSS